MAIKARDKLAIKRSRKGQGKRHKLEHILISWINGYD
jgi:hypothetical protein